MKTAINFVTAFLATMFFYSCKKATIEVTPLASLSVTNVIVGGTTAKFGSNISTIANNGYTQFGLLAGGNAIYIYPTDDSLHPYVNSNLSLSQSDVYSLFLSGTPAAIDTVLLKENIPYRTDSTAGIRFINLSPASAPLNITLSTSPTINEVTALAYKQRTNFKTYAGLYNTTYTFQIRNQAGNILTTFALTSTTVPRFANITLVIKGLTTGTPSLSVLRVNNDR